jgi:chromosome segregation ATPase
MSDVAKLQEELFAARQAYAQAQRRVSDLDGQLQDSKEENNTLKSQLRQHQTTESENRQNVQKVDELEGYLAGKEAENKRLKGRNQLLQEEVAELRSRFESKNLEASQAQGSAALHKSKLDEQAAQIMLLKRQLLEMEEEVRCFCRTTFYSQEARVWSWTSKLPRFCSCKGSFLRWKKSCDVSAAQPFTAKRLKQAVDG